jgi:hypothetical protein
VFGNAWEWTNDYFAALPGFQVHPYYEDFSTPCFDGLHHIIQGGSFISTGNEASAHSRFHFRPHFTQHASFRLVEVEVEMDAATLQAGFAAVAAGSETAGGNKHLAAMLTSDTDAPGPFVGEYPFRRSQLALQQAHQKKDAVAAATARNNVLLKHFFPRFVCLCFTEYVSSFMSSFSCNLVL